MEKEYEEYSGNAVVLMLCSSCNIKKCKHCYISYSGNFLLNEAIQLAKELNKKYTVLLNGAEVLCNPDYLKVYKEVGQNWILTNGYLIYNNIDILDKLKENGINTIEMSYHFDIQEQISIMKKEQLDFVIKQLKKYGFKIKLLTTITSYNYKNIEKFCEHCLRLGVDAIQFTNFISSGNASNMEKNNILTREQLNIFFEKLHNIRSKTNKKDLIIERSGTFGNDLNHHSNFYCPAGKDIVTITPNLKVYPCFFLAKDGYEIGYCKDGKIYVEKNIEYDSKKCLTLSKFNKL